MEYDTLNSELQVTKNRLELHSLDCEKILDEVTESVLSGGYTANGFQNTLSFMKHF